MRSLKQQLLLLVIGPLVVLALVGMAMTLTHIRDRAIYATDSKAKSDLATGEEILNLMYPGDWQVREGVLYKGEARISNNAEPVDRIAKLTGDTVTIFLGDTRVTTTVRKKDGQRAIGTKVSDAVGSRVLKNGEVFFGEANVIGERYRTAYKPIRDVNGNIIGMFYVGIAKKLSTDLIQDSMFKIVGFTGLLTVIVAILAWFFAQKVLVQPLQQITKSTRELATGQNYHKLDISSSNEIGELAVAFNQMVEGMQGFAQHISKVAGNSPDLRTTDLKTLELKTPELSQPERIKVVEPVSPQIPLDLPKGLNEATMKQILAFIEENREPMSAEEIGEGVNLTRVTARRYLEYFEQLGRVEVEQKYGTVGRPVKLYKSRIESDDINRVV